MFKYSKYIFFLLSIFILIIVVFFVLPYLITQTTLCWSYTESTGFIGDTIGGIVGPIVGFIGIILTFLAFYIQYQANKVQIDALNEQRISSKQQEVQIRLQQFENNFFELLKIHRENTNELKYRKSEGRNVIIKIINEFFDLLNIVQENGIIRNNRLDERDLANISFIILFFGVDKSVSNVLENRLFQKYSNLHTSINELIEQIRNKKAPTKKKVYYFNGHQSRIGHYFRHLRRTITFVHRNNFLTVEQKKDYIRILRAQLSNHEQILLFFFSISDLGLKWELESKTNEKLITDYSLIRNIPLGSIYGYNPKKYYPNLKLENNFELKL